MEIPLTAWAFGWLSQLQAVMDSRSVRFVARLTEVPVSENIGNSPRTVPDS